MSCDCVSIDPHKRIESLLDGKEVTHFISRWNFVTEKIENVLVEWRKHHWLHIWAATWQNQKFEYAPSEDSDQPGHSPSLIRVFAVRMKIPWVLRYALSAQRRLWSDWADAQADMSLRWAHSHFVGFVMPRLICTVWVGSLVCIDPWSRRKASNEESAMSIWMYSVFRILQNQNCYWWHVKWQSYTRTMSGEISAPVWNFLSLRFSILLCSILGVRIYKRLEL